MLEERMQLLSLLWAAGVRAETMHIENPSSAAQYDCAKQKGMLYLITIEASTHVDVANSSVTARAASHAVMLSAALPCAHTSAKAVAGRLSCDLHGVAGEDAW